MVPDQLGLLYWDVEILLLKHRDLVRRAQHLLSTGLLADFGERLGSKLLVLGGGRIGN